MTTPTEKPEQRLENFIEKLRQLSELAGVRAGVEQELIDELHALLSLARTRKQFHGSLEESLVHGSALPAMTGVWEHYRGGHYTLIGVARYHDTDWPMVLYVSHGHGGLSVRPAIGHALDRDGWVNSLPDGSERFRYVGPQL